MINLIYSHIRPTFRSRISGLYAKLDLLSKAEAFARIQDTVAQFGFSPLPDDFIDMNDKSSLIDLAINLEWALDRKDKNH